jgi:hypothetical protein
MSPILGIYASSISPSLNASSYSSIATVNAAGGGGSTSLTFSSIPSTYKHLQIRAIYRSTTSGGTDNIAFQFNGDTGANYTTHALIGDGAAASAAAYPGYNYMYLPSASPDGGNASGLFGAAVIDILDYTNTSKNRVVRALSGFDDNGAASYRRVVFSSSLWLNTAALTSIRFVTSANIAAGSTFALYGIK